MNDMKLENNIRPVTIAKSAVHPTLCFVYTAGNYGLMDQRAAIHWVYHNIDRFGGDQERITLFGPGAGAAAAGIHLMQQIYGEDRMFFLNNTNL